MKQEIVITKDGSNTLFVPELGEHYHSTYGAIQESRHIFINYGLRFIDKQKINILEIGFGTGLNALLTLIENYSLKKQISYTAIEKYPLQKDIYSQLNYAQILEQTELFNQLHNAKWEISTAINSDFTIAKLQKDIQQYSPKIKFDLIYFDAFAPDIQPELWTEEVFLKMYNALENNGVLVTYSAKGSVKRAMRAAGFNTEELPGPEGKRVVTRAIK